MYREGLAGKIKVELVATKKEAENATSASQSRTLSCWVGLQEPAAGGPRAEWPRRRVEQTLGKQSIERVEQRFERVEQRLGRRGRVDRECSIEARKVPRVFVQPPRMKKNDLNERSRGTAERIKRRNKPSMKPSENERANCPRAS